jgi:hypothetical protein
MANAGRGHVIHCVYLALLYDGGANVGLKNPLNDINRNFGRPLKCLHAMAYAILGVPGHISLGRGGGAISDAQF